jgi:demethylmenaquinone methyltransferase/2-methoxy-6-polyprenyl-1,4-benzoquinol methylase
MRKQDVIEFFDRLAPQWDADMIRHDDLIATILDNAGVTPGADVLDVACGTGVLFPDYLARDVGSLTAVDISPEMVRIARSKYPEDKVTVCCGDVEELDFDKQFDCIVVYNAFPHFPEPAQLIESLAGLLKPGGILTVAHGMSRAAIDRHHEGRASRVSVGLMHEDALAAIFRRHLQLTTKISTDRMYQVAGRKI